ncbi:DUF5134 domain-containing protein [Streptomyces sp. NPDC101490]|uniref:DUF5134 domain-containing protein n=1 Tax=Streptomyces sp. NPDC101490 TaxID=3366143 RepID=UPI0037F3D660
MHGAALSGWLMVALCTATGVYCLLRTRVCVGAARRAAGGEAVMGFGMASMALPAAVLTPPEWGWAVYAAVFGAAALHGLSGLFGGRHGGHHAHHLVGSLAMVYMALAMASAGPGAHAGHPAATAGGVPLLTGTLLLYYGMYVLHTGTRLVPVAAPVGVGTGGGGGCAGAGTLNTGDTGDTGGGWVTRPELALVCRLSMALVTVAMLLTL